MTATDALALVAVLGMAPIVAGFVAALFPPLPPLEPRGWVPVCDICTRPTSTAVAHTHHHEPGCGIDHPARQWCRCDYMLCPDCCPCSVTHQ